MGKTAWVSIGECDGRWQEAQTESSSLDKTPANKPACSSDDCLAADFSDLIDSIRYRRQSDEIFDEVCRDYEELAVLRNKALASGGNLSDPGQTDLVDTLAGLRSEILSLLLDGETK